MQVLVPLQVSLQMMEMYLSHCTLEGKARLIVFRQEAHAAIVVCFRDSAVDDLFSTLVFD